MRRRVWPWVAGGCGLWLSIIVGSAVLATRAVATKVREAVPTPQRRALTAADEALLVTFTDLKLKEPEQPVQLEEKSGKLGSTGVSYLTYGGHDGLVDVDSGLGTFSDTTLAHQHFVLALARDGELERQRGPDHSKVIPWEVADERRLVLFHSGGVPFGFTFSARVGTRIFFAQLFGVHFDEEGVKALLAPHVAALEATK